MSPYFFSVTFLIVTHPLISYATEKPKPIILAQSGGDNSELEGGMQQLSTYLLNFASYFGFNITSQAATMVSILLEQASTLDKDQQKAISLFLGIFQVPQIIDPNDAKSSALNQLANNIYKNYQSASGGTSNGALSVEPLIDQYIGTTQGASGTANAFAQDPVTQIIANALVTPGFDYCVNSAFKQAYGGSDSPFAQNCSSRYQETVAANIFGDNNFPTPSNIYQIDSNTLSQLNSNNLIEPLLYATTASNSGSSSTGLTANSQAQIAENYIRYSSSDVSPKKPIQLSTFTSLLQVINNSQSTPDQINAARSVITSYVSSQRSFAAQMSVATSNLFYILSKRMPQQLSVGEKSTNSSEALNEYNMATQRLYNPNSQAGETWIDKINEASSTTVQKEVAILLAEINYQLYLTRKQDERILLTNSMMLYILGQMLQAQLPTPTMPTQSSEQAPPQ